MKIRIEVGVNGEGLLVSCRVQNDALGDIRYGIIHAAILVLARTTLRVLSGKEGIVVRGEAPEHGIINIEIEYTEKGKKFLAGVSASLIEGLRSVAREYSYCCVLHTIKT